MISFCANPTFSLIFKMLLLLEVQVWNGINDKCRNEDVDESIVLLAYLILDRGKRRLLDVQEVSYDHLGFVFVLDC